VLDDLNRTNFHEELVHDEFNKRNVRVKYKKVNLKKDKSFHS
jgi:hypothetical protein